MKSKELKAVMVTDEPGDATRYDWLIADHDEYVVIADPMGTLFKSYSYQKDAIISFMNDFPDLKKDLSYTEYRDVVEECGCLNHHFIVYVCEKSTQFSLTAVSALRCAYKTILSKYNEPEKCCDNCMFNEEDGYCSEKQTHVNDFDVCDKWELRDYKYDSELIQHYEGAFRNIKDMINDLNISNL
jgi:hypothetical protein